MPFIDDLLQNANEARNLREQDVDNWTNEFERGFPKYTKWNPELKEHYWGVLPEERPKVRELNQEADARYEEGYRLLEVFPNRNIETLSWLLFGTPSEIRVSLNILMNQHRTADNSGDVFMGVPLNDWIRAASVTKGSVRLHMWPGRYGSTNYENKAYWSVRQVTIPYCDRSKLDYNAIRAACGGDDGMNWGQWTATATLKAPDGIGTIHQMKAKGRTKEQAERHLERFLPFTRCTFTNIGFSEKDYTKGERAKDADREERRSLVIYPGTITVLNQDTILSKLVRRGEPGKPTHTGKQVAKQFSREVTAVRAPSDWNAWLKNAFTDTQGKLIS